MNRPTGWAVLSLALVLALGGCAEKKSGESGSQASPPAQEQPPKAEPASQAVPTVQPSPDQSLASAEPARPAAVAQLGKQELFPAAAPPAPAPQPTSEPSRPPEAKPTPAEGPAPTETAKLAQTTPAAAQEPAPAESKNAAARDVIVLTGSPLGGVRFEHKLHTARAGNNCATCHHPSRPEKPASALQQACSDCHTKVAAAPMKTKHQAAFHDPTAQSGTCIDCHKAESAKAKKAPLNCMECHKQENK